MEDAHGRQEAPVEVRPMRDKPQAKYDRSCLDCDHIVAKRGWPWCSHFDKTTSLEVNGCHGFTPR